MPSSQIIVLGLLMAACVVGGPTFSQQPDGELETIEEFWPDGQLQLRKQVLRLEDGTVVDDGTFERWHSNGEKEYEAVLVRGRKEGTTVRYHKNGRKATEQEYRDGKRDGRCVTWNDAGVMVKEEHWKDGKPHGTWTVWEDGKVKWSHTYVEGKP
jgi:antitoxin component YwqK of YwqJK toxin-antitoxin module